MNTLPDITPDLSGGWSNTGVVLGVFEDVVFVMAEVLKVTKMGWVLVLVLSALAFYFGWKFISRLI